MFEIRKQFHFSASHILNGLPDGHQCGRLHGHNYIVEVVLCAKGVNEIGFVQDYGDLKIVREFLDTTFDHRHLNDTFENNPTAENMCAFLLNKFLSDFPELVAVRVSETPSTWAELRRPF